MTEQEQAIAWQQKVLHTVAGFCASVDKLYRENIVAASNVVPVKDNHSMQYVRNAFMDGLTGVFVLLAANSVGFSLEIEELAYKALREKFKEFRSEQFRKKIQK